MTLYWIFSAFWSILGLWGIISGNDTLIIVGLVNTTVITTGVWVVQQRRLDALEEQTDREIRKLINTKENN